MTVSVCPVCAYWQDRIASTEKRIERGSVLVAHQFNDDAPSWWDEDSCLMAIELGYDESGDSGDMLLVSVQLGITEQAKKMKRAWKKRLPVELPYFHAKDFGNYTGGTFTKAGLDRSARSKLLGDLCGFIHRRLLGGVTVQIKISEYERLTTQDFRSRHGSAYSFAVDMCLLGAYSIAKQRGLRPDFNILIESGHRNSNQAVQILAALMQMSDETRNSFKDRLIPDLDIKTAGLGDKKEHPILQSADMLAYSEWQRVLQRDDTIWNALRPTDDQYLIAHANCDEELITAAVSEGITLTKLFEWKKQKARYAAKRHRL